MAAHSPLTDRRILVGVAGGIAAYKSAALVSRLAQAGAQVTVLMTESATRFVGPLTFQSLSGRTVWTSPWQADDRPESQHIALARSAELLVIAPATANLMARLAAGLCDDVVTIVACAVPRPTPVLLAPGMNEQMWEHPVTQRNLATLRELAGYEVIGPEAGWQACRTEGAGRMSEPETILQRVIERLAV